MRRWLVLASLLLGLAVPVHALSWTEDGGSSSGGAVGDFIENSNTLTPGTTASVGAVAVATNPVDDARIHTISDTAFSAWRATFDLNGATQGAFPIMKYYRHDHQFLSDGLVGSMEYNAGFNSIRYLDASGNVIHSYDFDDRSTTYGNNGVSVIGSDFNVQGTIGFAYFDVSGSTDIPKQVGNSWLYRINASTANSNVTLQSLDLGGVSIPFGRVHRVCKVDASTHTVTVTGNNNSVQLNYLYECVDWFARFNSGGTSGTWYPIGVMTSTSTEIPDNSVDGTKLALSSDPDTANPEYIVAIDTTTEQMRPLAPITTFYFEQSRESPRLVYSGTTNAFDTSAATNTYYGLMKFSHSTSSESNCGYFVMPAVRDYNTSIDFRLDEFRVVNGTGTDTGDQYYYIAVASKTTGKTWRTETYTQPIIVDMSSSLGTVAGEERALAGVQTLTSWNTVITSGVPWAVSVCRDGDDATNDPSSIDSYFSMLTIRAANTIP